jgi:hypothetical protein
VSRRAALAALLAAPFLVAATDPRGDVGPCTRGRAGTRDARIDVVDARGEIVERGTALRFTVVFASPPEIPDREGRPFRVDVVLRDPELPTVSFRYYRDLNRIVRFDAVSDPLVQIVLLPERGANVFVGATLIGDTLTMTLPGRLVARDLDVEGLGLERLRWGLIVRDEADCDLLGGGRPSRRLVEASAPAPTPRPSPLATGAPSSSVVPVAVAVAGLAAAWAVGVLLRRRAGAGRPRR